MFSKNRLAEKIKDQAVKRGDFTLTSGKKSSFYIDIKKAYTDPHTMNLIVEGMAEVIKDEHFDRIAGMELGGVPIATALSLKTNLPFIIIRKKKRTHGTNSRIEGDLKNGEKVIMVDDIVTTGGSIKNGIEALKDEGVECKKVIAVVDRLEGASDNLEKFNIRLKSLLTLKDL